MEQLAILTLVYFIISAVFWFCHIHEVKSNYEKYGWASFTTFKNEYAKRMWRNDDFRRSHDSRSIIGGYDISFEGRGMILGYKEKDNRKVVIFNN